jgi:hypothetical protein
MKTKNLLPFFPAVFLAIATLAFPLRLTAAAEQTLVFTPDADTRILNTSPTDGDGETSKTKGKPDGLMGVYRGRDRCLISFDVSSIPKDAKITSAVLQLTTNAQRAANPKGAPMNLFRITKSWDEPSATWTMADSFTSWENPGGDAVGMDNAQLEEPYATNNETGGDNIKFDWDVTGLVSEWVSGKFPNHGLMIKTDDVSNGLHFYTKEQKDVELHPVLKVQFSK